MVPDELLNMYVFGDPARPVLRYLAFSNEPLDKATLQKLMAEYTYQPSVTVNDMMIAEHQDTILRRMFQRAGVAHARMEGCIFCLELNNHVAWDSVVNAIVGIMADELGISVSDVEVHDLLEVRP
jgi:hypothetical protein